VAEADPDKQGMHLPAWVVEWGRKLIPYLLGALIGGGFKLYYDNVGNMRDIAHNSWWNREQDKRHERGEDRTSRLESRQDRSEETDAEFHGEMREKMDRLLKLYRR
jgi:hypothetical protein